MELTIKDQVYTFNFGMGFLREINKTAITNVNGMDGVKANVGFRLALINLFDKDVETLFKVLMIANKGQNPRLTESTLEYFIDNECEDIAALFNEVLDFLKQSNATKETAADTLEALDKEMARQKKIAELNAQI